MQHNNLSYLTEVQSHNNLCKSSKPRVIQALRVPISSSMGCSAMARDLAASYSAGQDYMKIYYEESAKSALLELGGNVASLVGFDGKMYLYPRFGSIGRHEEASIALDASENTILIQKGQALSGTRTEDATSNSYQSCTISTSGLILNCTDAVTGPDGQGPLPHIRLQVSKNISLNALNPSISLGGGFGSGQPKIYLHGHHPDGGYGAMSLASSDGQNTMYFHGGEGIVSLKNKESKTTINLNATAGNIRLGGNGTDGDILLFSRSTVDTTKDIQARIWLDADQGNLAMGGNGQDGDLFLFPKSATISTTDISAATIHLDGDSGRIDCLDLEEHKVTIDAKDGLSLHKAGKRLVSIDLVEGIVFSEGDKRTITIDRKAGDILLCNADCAEDFDISDLSAAEPGTVMVIEDEGSLCTSTQAYDNKVAGVISGAGNLRPGMVLDRQSGINGRMPVALMGKVYCKVDAEYAPIKVGDLLTTSPTKGHAMKATDPTKAFGAVIGKALKPLTSGKGMIPIIVALQ